ncbi:hypothetical protein EV175_000841 [Coemansia sp. RSA 1933]|nr:hypothetical protein EV175_000841 [Coemansia sp. RSA 1933]
MHVLRDIMRRILGVRRALAQIPQQHFEISAVAARIWQGVSGLNYTGETALLDAAPADPSRRHATAVTFGELGVFDFRGDGRARVALELGAFSSEKESTHVTAGKMQRRDTSETAAVAARRDELSRVLALGTNEINRPVRDTEPIELDHVYLIFARSRAVNNFVARLHSGGMRVQEDNDDMAATMLCSNVGGWLESEFIAPITALRRPKPSSAEAAAAAGAAVGAKDDAKGAEKESNASGGSASSSTKDAAPKISFISASSPSAQVDLLLPKPTRVTASGTVAKREVPAVAAAPTTPTSSAAPTSSASNSTADGPLLGADSKANDVFLVEYEWEWLVPRGGEYAVVIANCAATTIQFKYNLIMANRRSDGTWTNVAAGWMPVHVAFPATCYSLWAMAVALWLWAQGRHRMNGHAWRRQPLAALMVGAVPVLRLMSCVADLSRHSLWSAPAAGAYEITMVVVSTSLVDALADGAQLLVLLALAKGWGVVRARLAGAEKRLVPGLVVFVGVASLYDGATRGGGVLAVGVLECVALVYAWAALAHTRRVHAVQTLRLVSRNESALAAWYAAADPSSPPIPPARMLRSLAARPWSRVHDELAAASQPPAAVALMWSAAKKDRLLAWVQKTAVPLQALDVVVLLVASFAVPPHYAFVGLLLVQAAHWAAFMAVLGAIVAGGLGCPDVALPALPAIATRRSIPLPPATSAGSSARRTLPPLGRLHLLRSSAPFAANST